jgi:D-sedoheptulose 7-phosphate isomerase
MTKDFKPLIESRLREASRVLAAAARLAPQISRAAEILLAALGQGRKILIFGNGGSAADAQHFAAELVGRFERNRPPLPAMALSVDTSNLTAIANDFGFEKVFARQLEAHAKNGDVAVAISTSGNSPSVLKAVATARKLGLFTVGLSGARGGRLKGAVDLCLCAPSTSTPRIQEVHGAVIHLWCEILENTLFPNAPKAH